MGDYGRGFIAHKQAGRARGVEVEGQVVSAAESWWFGEEGGVGGEGGCTPADAQRRRQRYCT